MEWAYMGLRRLKPALDFRGTWSPGYARPDTSGRAHPGLLSVVAARLVDANIRIELVLV